jgi:hypothetical protein
LIDIANEDIPIKSLMRTKLCVFPVCGEYLVIASSWGDNRTRRIGVGSGEEELPFAFTWEQKAEEILQQTEQKCRKITLIR